MVENFCNTLSLAVESFLAVICMVSTGHTISI